MTLGNINQDFDQYRKQRIRGQAKVGPAASATDYSNSALRELEQVEQREVRDQQLTREVHEFFASATRQAATIVERMSHAVEQRADVRVQTEMEAFLMDAFARMNTLVLALVQKKRGVAETQLEPNVTNIVGQSLDEFRWMGTAGLMDKHIGQDPFATDLDEVRREFATHAHASGGGAAGAAPAAIEEHLVARLQEEAAAAEEAEAAEVSAPEATTAAAAGGPKAAAAEPEADKGCMPNAVDELERFKEALKSLVRQGTMTRDEARAAWATRLQALGLQRTNG